MSREIKFRDFEPELKKMRYFNLEQFDREEHNSYGNIMQYTGLLDKNGKEIYEGDIIKIDNKHASLVLFKNGMFGVSEDAYSFISLKEFFVGVESTKKYISNYGEIFEEYKAIFEVIGTIYENPELITEVKNG